MADAQYTENVTMERFAFYVWKTQLIRQSFVVSLSTCMDRQPGLGVRSLKTHVYYNYKTWPVKQTHENTKYSPRLTTRMDDTTSEYLMGIFLFIKNRGRAYSTLYKECQVCFTNKINTEDGGSMSLWNMDICPQNETSLLCRRATLTSSPWEPQNSWNKYITSWLIKSKFGLSPNDVRSPSQEIRPSFEVHEGALMCS
jgi:hypothetical protein